MDARVQRIAEKVDAIEQELRRLHCWSPEPLPPEKYEFKQAFAMDTMAFTQWLQFVFVVRVRALIASRGPFPEKSQVSVQATREFDGQPEAGDLTTLLREFDALFGPE